MGKLRLPRRASLVGIVFFSLATAGALLAVVATAGLASAASGASAAAPWRLLGVTLSSGRNYGPIACATPSRCWVPFSSPRGGGAGVLATSDGGAYWSVEHVPGHAAFLSGISCTSQQDCWLVGNSGSLGGRSAGAAFRTVNGGQSWQPLTLPSELGPGPQHQLNSISCRGPGWCAAVGSGSGPSQVSCGPGCTMSNLLAAVSTNGGRSWAVEPVPLNPVAQLNSISCGAAGTCQAVGFGLSNCRPSAQSAKATSCSPGGAVVGSRQGGSRWVDEPVGTGIFNLYGISCPTALQCWATGSTGNDVRGRGVILHSTDGGAHWARQAPVPGSNSLTDVSCPTVRWCAAAGLFGTAGRLSPAIETTSDGGAHWAAAALPPGVSEVIYITCSAPGQCLAKGIVGFGSNQRFVLLAG